MQHIVKATTTAVQLLCIDPMCITIQRVSRQSSRKCVRERKRLSLTYDACVLDAVLRVQQEPQYEPNMQILGYDPLTSFVLILRSREWDRKHQARVLE